MIGTVGVMSESTVSERYHESQICKIPYDRFFLILFTINF